MLTKLTRTFWKDTGERAFWTFIGAFLVAAGYTSGMRLEDIDWVASADIALAATIFSSLKSVVVGKLPVGTPGTASAVQLDPDQ